MFVQVLGSAAGGGFPQWNCNCRLCAGQRDGSVRAFARTQSSIAVSADGIDWALCNASPDILQQIRAFPALQPGRALRDTGIAAVLLIDAQVDHTTGLYMLREHRGRLPVWCTDEVDEDLRHANPLFGLLEHYCGAERHRVPLDAPFAIARLPGLRFDAVPLVGNAPPYSPRRDAPRPGDNIGLVVEDVGRGRARGARLFYAPGLGAITPPVRDAMASADVVLVDGTFWTDDEMQRLGVSTRSARAMGHLAQSGPEGMIAVLAALPATTRKVLIHINNTNPILDEDGPQRAELARHGIEVAFDGMSLEIA